MRTLFVCNERWQVRIGRDCAVLRDAQGRRCVVPLDALTRRSLDTLARGRWKRTSDGWVTPADVTRYLQTHLVFAPQPRARVRVPTRRTRSVRR